MAAEDCIAYRAVDAAQYAGTAIADAAEVIGSIGGDGARQAVEAVYRQGAFILGAALGIGNQAGPIAPDTVVQRMQVAKRATQQTAA